MERIIRVLRTGKLKYGDSLKLQQYFKQQHFLKGGNSNSKDVLVIVEHDPVYTIGIRNKDYTEDDKKRLRELGADFYETNRGGLITFHGPGQLVAYPIINLKNYKPSVRWYVSNMEQTIIDMCQKLDLKAETSPHTGVWVS